MLSNENLFEKIQAQGQAEKSVIEQSVKTAQLVKDIEDFSTNDKRLLYLQNEQAYLVDFIIANYSKIPEFEGTSDDVTVLKDKSNEQFINETCYTDGFEDFFSITSYQHAQIVPNIAFYKQFFEDGRTSSTDEQEFVFKNYTDLTNIDQITAERGFRGSACGIKDVKIDLDGKNPATGQFTSVSAVFIFNDVQDVFSDTVLSSGKRISYADLFSYPKISDEDGSFYQIKLVVGWNGSESVFPKLDLKFSKMVLSLQLKSYSIELREDGFIQLKIEYIGTIENMFYDSQAANLLKTSDTTKKELNDALIRQKSFEATKNDKVLRQKIKDKYSQQINDNKNINVFGFDLAVGSKKTAQEKFDEIDSAIDLQINQKIKEQKTIIENIKLNEKTEGLKAIFSDSNKIYNVSLTKEQLDEYIKAVDEGGFDTTTAIAGSQIRKSNETKIISDDIDVHKMANKQIYNVVDAVESIYGTLLAPINEANKLSENLLEKKYISFMFLGDLVQMVYDYVKKDLEKKYKQVVEIKLGEIIVVPPLLNQKVRMSIAKLPVSLANLNHFFVNKIIGRSNEVYTFGQFLEEIVKELFEIALQQSGRMKTNLIRNNFDLLSFPVYKTSNGYTTLNDGKIEKQCIFFYSSTKDCNNVSTDYLTNISNKIPHFYFAGTDRGIIKSIKFTDNTSQKFAMAIFERSKETNTEIDTSKQDGVIQPKFYKITVKTTGCPFFTIGQTIYLDTNTIGINNNSKGRNLYIGGSYFINKVSHSLSKDTYETTFEATFQIPDDGLKERKFDNIKTVEQISREISDSLSLKNPDLSKNNKIGVDYSSIPINKIKIIGN